MFKCSVAQLILHMISYFPLQYHDCLRFGQYQGRFRGPSHQDAHDIVVRTGIVADFGGLSFYELVVSFDHDC